MTLMLYGTWLIADVIQLMTLRWGVILGYLSGPSVITRVLQ